MGSLRRRTVVRLKIRPDVTFQDGTPLDAKAVETNFLRQFDAVVDFGIDHGQSCAGP